MPTFRVTIGKTDAEDRTVEVDAQHSVHARAKAGVELGPDERIKGSEELEK